MTQSPFAFGSLSTLGHTFHRIISYDDYSLLVWLKNSAIYSFGGTALAILAAIPAGYGLALTHFIGRRTLLVITLIVMIMPATALVLPLFLEMDKIGSIRHRLVADTAIRVLPLRRLSRLHLLLLHDPQRPARGSEDRRGRRMACLPLHRAAARRPIVALVGFSRSSRPEQFLSPLRYDLRQLAISGPIGLNELIGSTASFNPANYTAGSGVTLLHRPDLAMAVILAVAPVLIVFLFAQPPSLPACWQGRPRSSRETYGHCHVRPCNADLPKER